MKILIALLFMPMAAFAADWVLIYADQNVELEIDKQSVRSNKGAWFQTIYTPAVGEGCAGTAKKKASAKYFIEASCKEFTTRTKQTIYYAEDGSVLEYCGYNDPKAAFTEYAPETLGEFHFRAICDPKGRVKNRFALLVRESKPGNKPMFAQCEASSDCSGNLLCKPSGGTPTMRCFPPD